MSNQFERMIIAWRGILKKLRFPQLPPRVKQLLRLTLQIIVLLFCFIYLYVNARQLQQYPDIFNIQIGYLLGSIVMIFAALALGAMGWSLVLRSMQIDMYWREAFRVHLSSNLAKYIPGYGWQLVGKAYLTKSQGISTRLTSLAIITELAILFLTGMILIALLVIFYSFAIPQTLRQFILIGGICAVALLTIWSIILPKLGARIWQENFTMSPLIYGFAVFVAIISWLCFGFSFWLTGASFVSLNNALPSLFIFSLISSFLISLAVLIVPGGFGIRESVMVFLLGSTIGSTPAVLIAATSRLLLIICEVVAAFIARLLVNPKR